MDKIDLNQALKQALAKSSGETIRIHTDKLKERLETLKKIYGNQIQNISLEKYREKLWDIVSIVIEYHDYGKLHSPFQKKLLKKKQNPPYELIDIPEIPHNFLSLCFLTDEKINSFNENIREDIKKVIFQSIAYHHNREIDERLYQRIIEKVAEKDLKRFQENLNLKFWSYIDPKNYLKPEDNELFKLLVIIKGLLHRLDYTASGDVEIELEKQNFKEIIKGLFNKNSLGFKDFQNAVIEANDKNTIIIAPTGGGKTETGGLFIGEGKGFFVLPLRASINAIYDRFTGQPQNGKLRYNYQNVGLLHSASLFRLMESISDGSRTQEDDTNIKFDDIFRMEKEARNLSNHITVCTADQLFPFVFKYAGFERIYFTLGYSKVVLDEIQMYNPRMLAFIVKGLQAIKELGGRILIMTATFPEFLKKYFEGFENKIFSDDSVRHNLRIDEKIIDDDIINSIKENGKHKKVLVICNTIKKAIEVYEKLIANNANIKGLLHSRFIQKHRNLLEEEIKNFAPNRKSVNGNSESGIWITTQIAEVSLDIDFDILYTELSTIDSLIQRMGRVNRSGNYKIDPNIIVCTEECSGIGKVYDEEIFNLTKTQLQQLQNNQTSFDFSESQKMEVVKNIFKDENLKDSKYIKDFENSIAIIDSLWNIGKLYNPIETLKEAQKQFREIFNITVIPESVYENEKTNLEEAKKGLNSNDKEKRYNALKSIMDYTVSVPFYYVKNKWLFFEDIYIAQCEYDFDEKTKKGEGFKLKSIKDENLID